jgi:hypothetical protein
MSRSPNVRNNPKGDFCEVLNGSFLIFGDHKSGKSVLVEKMKGTYVPSLDRVSHSGPGIMSTGVELKDRLMGFTVPSSENMILNNALVRRENLDTAIKDVVQEIQFSLQEIPALKTDSAWEELSSALHEAQARVRSSGNQFFLEGMPLSHNVCGTMWVIRGNQLACNVKPLVKCLYDFLKPEVIKSSYFREILEVSRSLTSVPGGTNRAFAFLGTNVMLPLHLEDECKDRIVSLYKKELTLHLADVHNQVLNVHRLPSFLSTPVTLVFNKSDATSAFDIAEATRVLVKKLAKKAKKTSKIQVSANVLASGTPEKERTDPAPKEEIEEEEKEETLEEMIARLLKYGTSMTCDAKTFCKLIDYPALRYKLSPSGKVSLNKIAQVHPRGENNVLYRYDSWEPKKIFFARHSLLLPTLMLGLNIEKPKARMPGSSARSEANQFFFKSRFSKKTKDLQKRSTSNDDNHNKDRVDDIDDLEDEEQQQDYQKLLKSNLANQKQNRPSKRATASNNTVDPSMLFVPPHLSVCFTKLGDEATSADVQITREEQLFYVKQRQLGRLVYDVHSGEDRLPCDQLEFHLYNWMLDCCAWNFEVKNASQVGFN